jgi:transcriptional regulator with XRE-family HTH domain
MSAALSSRPAAPAASRPARLSQPPKERTMDNRNTPHPTDVHVGIRLRARRKEIGASQHDLAQALNMTFQQVQKYEKGINRISASKLLECANYLGVSFGYFVAGLEKAAPAGTATLDAKVIDNARRASAAIDLVPAIVRLPELKPQARRAIQTIIEMCAQVGTEAVDDEELADRAHRGFCSRAQSAQLSAAA